MAQDGQQIDSKSTKKRKEINQKSCQHQTKIDEKVIRNGPRSNSEVLQFMPTAAGKLGDIQREKPYSIRDLDNFHATSDSTPGVVQHVIASLSPLQNSRAECLNQDTLGKGVSGILHSWDRVS